MLFETRHETPEVSSGWETIRDLFLKGRVPEALEAVRTRDASCRPDTPNDYILLIEIARAGGLVQKSFALSRLARRTHPENTYVQLYHARTLISRGRHWPSIRYLESSEPRLQHWADLKSVVTPPPLAGEPQTPGDLPADQQDESMTLYSMLLADLYGDAGFAESCLRWLDRARGMPKADSALSLYMQAGAHHGLKDWDKAIELVQSCVEKAPGFARARAFLLHCLLTKGRIDEALDAIEAGEKIGIRDASLELTRAMLVFSRGHFEEAEQSCRRILEDWPHADFIPWVRRTLFILLVELDRLDEAREVVDGEEEKLALPELPENISGDHHFIPLPLVAQKKNECVPTCVAMAVWPHGQTVDTTELFKEMHGREGVTLWRMRQWGEAHGYKVIPIELTCEATRGLLDRNIPLIGTIEYPFNSHVEILCGYHEALDVFYLRDPAHWTPGVLDREAVFQRYKLYGSVLAFVPPDDAETLAFAESVVSEPGEALLDLAQAVARGQRESAEAAFNRIPEASDVAYLRDAYAWCVVISAEQFQQRMADLAAREDAHPIARFRCMLSLGSDKVQDLLQDILDQSENQIGPMGRSFLQFLQHLRKGDWPQAEERLGRLMIHGGAVAEVWDLKSDLLWQTGRQNESRRALESALELEPLRLSLRQKWLDRRSTKLIYTEYLEAFDRLIESDPDDKRLLWGRVSALLDGPDGAAYEEAIRAYMTWFPRNAEAPAELMRWLLYQGRMDLFEDVLRNARALMPDEFPESDDDEKGDAPNPEERKPVEKEADPHADLPDYAPLMEKIWDAGEPDYEDALEQLLNLHSKGRLTWYDDARLLASRLCIHPEQETLTPGAVKQILPETMPTTPIWFVGSVIDILVYYNLLPDVADEVTAWVETSIPDYRNFVETWFNRVLLLEKSGQLERALVELNALLKRYPAHSSALYRMGLIKYRQRDYADAESHLKRSLDVNPGLPGSMEVLKVLYEESGKTAEELDCIRAIRRKYPRDVSHLKSEVLAVARHESPTAARQLLHDSREGFPELNLRLLDIRLDLKEGKADAVKQALASMTLADDERDDVFEEFMQLRMSIALEENNDDEVSTIAREGLERWPDSVRLKEILADVYAGTDEDKARDLLMEALGSGV
ncbi:MAG: tetratricopeptide repeat protein, partial [Verrucomicrobiota bacterium]